MHLKRFLLITVLLLCCTSRIFPQAIFERITDENGLPHNSVRRIVSDSQGFIWLGTLGGIHRYDGYEYKSFLHDPWSKTTIPSDDITSFAISGDSLMWVGTDNGLCKLNLKTYQISNIQTDSVYGNSLKEPRIRSLCLDQKNRLWIGTRDSGLFVMDKESKEKIQPLPLDQLKFITSLMVDSKQRLWVGSYSFGAAQIDAKLPTDQLNSKIFELKGFDPKVENCPAYGIFEDHSGIIWLATRNGLFWFDETSQKFILQKVDPKQFDPSLLNTFNCIINDAKGKIWLASYNGLLRCDNLFDLEKGKYDCFLHNVADKNSLLSNQIHTLCTDSSGVLWIGADNGLTKFNPFKNQFHILKTEGLDPDTPLEATCFAEDVRNDLLIGTHSKGLLKLRNNRFVRTSLAKANITTIYTEDQSLFWIGTWDGKLIYYNSLQDKVIKILNVDRNDPVSSISDGFDGKIIFTCYSNGAYLLDRKDHTIEPLKNYIPDMVQFLNKSFKDKNGIIWFGSNIGLYRYDPVKKSSVLYRFNRENLYNNNYNVADICEDESGTLWFGTLDGLYFYNSKENLVQSANIKDVALNLYITNLVARNGTIFLNINYNRLGVYKPLTKEFTIYIVNNGSRSHNYGLRGFYQSKNNTIWFGGENEINYFNPDELTKNSYAPIPMIVDFKVNNKEVEIGEKLNGQIVLDKVINLKESVKLNYNNRNFALSFATSSYIDQQRNLFAYKLEGFQNKWDTVNFRNRNIQFINLNPGNYTLHLKASNDLGFWSPERQLKIRISPPFWLSIYALGLYLVILTTIILISRRIYKVRRALKNQILIEKVKSERDEKYMNEKIRFFTNISHELKTPLTLILGPIRQLMDLSLDDPKITSKHKLIFNNASRLLRLVNQIIEFRKAELNKLELNVAETEIIAFVEELFQSFQTLATEKKLRYKFKTNQNHFTGWIDQDKLERIVFNLLSNAFKFTDHGHINLEVKILNNNMEVCVSDTGSGIPQSKQQHIFERFYQVNHHVKYNTGSGIGLSLVKSLVELHRGKIWFESEEGRSSTFCFTIPVSKESYLEEELFKEKNLILSEKKEVIEFEKPANQPIFDCKVLVIEDNVELRQYLVDSLSENFSVFSASNGLEGIEKVKDIQPDIVVSDIMMEKMDGFEFCKRLKNDSEISHIPVILLTALSETEHRKEGYKIGADDYILKPFDPSLLQIRINNILENRKKIKVKYSSDPDLGIESLSHSAADDDFISKLKKYIEENIENEDLNIDMICDKFNFSQSKLYRKVKELTDMAPNEIIRTIRLKKATEHLKSGYFNVTEVSMKVGFSDPLYFSRCFSKQFGFPPSKIMNN